MDIASKVRRRQLQQRFWIAFLPITGLLGSLIDGIQPVALIAWSLVCLLAFCWPLLFGGYKLLVKLSRSATGDQLRIDYLDALLRRRQWIISIHDIQKMSLLPGLLLVRDRDELHVAYNNKTFVFRINRKEVLQDTRQQLGLEETGKDVTVIV